MKGNSPMGESKQRGPETNLFLFNNAEPVLEWRTDMLLCFPFNVDFQGWEIVLFSFLECFPVEKLLVHFAEQYCKQVLNDYFTLIVLSKWFSLCIFNSASNPSPQCY